MPSKSPQTGGLSAEPRARLVVFAKHWTPGESKTRLAAAIGAEPAAWLSKAFLETTLKNLEGLEGIEPDRRLLYTPPERGVDFEELTAGDASAWRPSPQPAGDLGTRMRCVLEDSDTPVVIVGSDSPDMPREAVAKALGWLSEESGRFVVGPSDDGGYWLVGCHGEPPDVFSDMPWGTGQVFASTLERLQRDGRRQGTDYLVLPQWYDVDTVADLNALHDRLQNRNESEPWFTELRRLVGPFCGRS